LACLTARSGKSVPCIKVLLFDENQAKIEKWKRIGCLFVENTQTLFEKSKTDVQGAENRQVRQIDMAQMSNCDKIKVDMHFNVWIYRIGKAAIRSCDYVH